MKTKLTTIIFIAIALLMANTLTYADKPIAFKAEYDALIKGFAVKASRELKSLDNEKYELSFRASSLIASINEVSIFNWQDNQLQPYIYDFNQTVFGKKKRRSIAFDNENKNAISSDKGSEVTMNISKNTFDPLSYQLQLQLDLAQDNKDLAYTIINKNTKRNYSFELLGDEVIDTKAGKLSAIKVKVIRENKDKITYIWFAKDWQYLLAKLEQYEGDKKKLSISLKTAVVNEQIVTSL